MSLVINCCQHGLEQAVKVWKSVSLLAQLNFSFCHTQNTIMLLPIALLLCYLNIFGLLYLSSLCCDLLSCALPLVCCCQARLFLWVGGRSVRHGMGVGFHFYKVLTWVIAHRVTQTARQPRSNLDALSYQRAYHFIPSAIITFSCCTWKPSTHNIATSRRCHSCTLNANAPFYAKQTDPFPRSIKEVQVAFMHLLHTQST